MGALLDEREAADKEIRKGQSIYHTLLDHSQDMILLSSMDGSTRYVSPGVRALSGWTPAEFVSFLPLDTMHVEDRPLARGIIESLREGKTERQFRYRIRCKDGRYRWVEASMLSYGDETSSQLTGYVATIRDISAHALLEQAWSEERDELAQQNKFLSALAGNDELTGIANRRTFNRMLTQEVHRHKRLKNSLSLLMFDVDFFKKYNDRYGHPMGDDVLKTVATVLVESSRATDLAARVGGEEFAVLLPDTDAPGALHVAARILARIRELQIVHDESPFGFTTLSIGSATWEAEATGEEAHLIQQADRSLYESKRSGRNKVT
ncbi:MAG: GGDEF domain-containing protein [Janthinobacterium lividum]